MVIAGRSENARMTAAQIDEYRRATIPVEGMHFPEAHLLRILRWPNRTSTRSL